MPWARRHCKKKMFFVESALLRTSANDYVTNLMKTPTDKHPATTEVVLAHFINAGDDPTHEQVETVRARLTETLPPEATKLQIEEALDVARQSLSGSQASAANRVITKAEFDARIRRDVVELRKAIVGSIELPEGTAWHEAPSDELKWFLGDPVRSVASGLSIVAGKVWDESVDWDSRTGDPDQIAMEIRVFLPETHYTDGGKEHHFRQYSGEHYAAHIWVQTGPQWAFKFASHVVDEDRYPKGDTIAQLAKAIGVSAGRSLDKAAAAVNVARRASTNEREATDNLAMGM